MRENDENRDTRCIVGAEVHSQFACRKNGHNLPISGPWAAVLPSANDRLPERPSNIDS